MACLMNANNVVALKSGITAIRARPVRVPRFSTATTTSAASPQRLLWTSHPRVVQFDLAVQGLARQVDHGAPELMQEQPSRFIPADRQLSLEQRRRNPAFVRGYQHHRDLRNSEKRRRNIEHFGG